MIQSSLKKLGLSENEVTIFLALFRVGEAPASSIAKKTKLPRTTVFDTLMKLSKKGLVQRLKKFNQYYFNCEDEAVLKKYTQKEQARWQKNQTMIEKVLPLLHNLKSPFSPAPTIQFYEGPVQVSTIYEDILKTGEDICLIRSLYDHDNEELATLLDQYVPKQVAKGIHVRALTPQTDTTIDHFLHSDKDQLLERRVLDPKEFALPAQIMLYGQKVAIITHKNHIFGTVIEDEDVHATLKILFEMLWKAAETPHNEFLKQIKKPSKK